MSFLSKTEDIGHLIKRIVEKVRPDLSPYMRFPVTGVVTAVYPEEHTVDVQPDDERMSPLPKCKVLTPWAAHSTYLSFLPSVEDRVVVGFLNGESTSPYIEGFIQGAKDEGGSFATKMRLQWDNPRDEDGEEAQSLNYIEADAGADTSMIIQSEKAISIKSGTGDEEIRPTITIDTDGNVIVNPGVSGMIKLGKDAIESVVLGKFLEDFFSKHTHMGNNGAPTSKPNELIPPKPLDDFLSKRIIAS